MKNPMQTSSVYLFFFFLLFLFSFFFSTSLSDPRISEAELYCGDGRPPANTSIVPTFTKVMQNLSQEMNTSHWATNSINSSATKTPIYVLSQCHEDLSNTDCLLCYAAARTRIPRCLPATSARLFLDGCFLRYDNYSFYGESVDAVHDTVNCSSRFGAVQGASEKKKFLEDVGFVVGNVTRLALKNGGIGVGEVKGKGVFGLAQCWETVGESGCRECFRKASSEIEKCGASREGRSLNAGCYLRYSTEKFYSDGKEGNSGGSK